MDTYPGTISVSFRPFALNPLILNSFYESYDDQQVGNNSILSVGDPEAGQCPTIPPGGKKEIIGGPGKILTPKLWKSYPKQYSAGARGDSDLCAGRKGA